MALFDVWLMGPAAAETPRDTLVSRLATAFSIPHDRAARLLNDAPVLVKHHVDLDMAMQFQKALIDSGLRSSLSDEGQPPPETPPCPKCGYVRQAFDLAHDYECPKCGVVYAKFLAVQQRRAALVEQQQAYEEKKETFEAETEAAERLPVPDMPEHTPAPLFSGPRDPVPAEAPPEFKTCPLCFEEIRREAIKCRHCHSRLPKSPVESEEQAHALKSRGIRVFLGAFALLVVARIMMVVGFEEVEGSWMMQPTGAHYVGFFLSNFVCLPLGLWGANLIVRSKGRHGAWTLAGVFSLVGLAVVLSLQSNYDWSKPAPR